MSFVRDRRSRRKFIIRTRLLLRRRLHRLPNVFTLANGFFGFASMLYAGSGDFVSAAYFILFGALFDALDGRVARLLGITSELGGELDSLCDAVSFCLAPALLVYHWELYEVGVFGFMIAACYALAGLVRLARFNITKADQMLYFLGVPTTIAGCFIATIYLVAEHYDLMIYIADILPMIVLGLAFLMVSSIRFPTFKHISRWWYAGVITVFVVCMTTLGFIDMLCVLFIGYFCFSAAEVFRLRFFSKKTAPGEAHKIV